MTLDPCIHKLPLLHVLLLARDGRLRAFSSISLDSVNWSTLSVTINQGFFAGKCMLKPSKVLNQISVNLPLGPNARQGH